MYKIQFEDPSNGRWRDVMQMTGVPIEPYTDPERAFADAEKLTKEGVDHVRVVDDVSGVMIWETRQEQEPATDADVVTSAPKSADDLLRLRVSAPEPGLGRLLSEWPAIRPARPAIPPPGPGTVLGAVSRLAASVVGKPAAAVPPPPALSARARELARALVEAQAEFVAGMTSLKGLSDRIYAFESATAHDRARLRDEVDEAHAAAVEILANLRNLAES